MAAKSRRRGNMPQRNFFSHAWAGQQAAPTSAKPVLVGSPGKFRLPILPQAHRRGLWFPSDGANDGDAVVVPQTGLSPDAEIANEGVPFRLPRAAYPPECSSGSAGTFQRGSCKPLLQDGDHNSSARHYRQARHNSQNLSNISTCSLRVNRSLAAQAAQRKPPQDSNRQRRLDHWRAGCRVPQVRVLLLDANLGRGRFGLAH